MRGLLLALALVLILILVGWITFSFTGEKASVTLEKGKIQEDTRELSQSARDFAKEADERVRGTVEPEVAPQP
jgi:hypothetical protein